jgi:hypothetical protein
MSAAVHAILSRARDRMGQTSRIEDFVLALGEPFDANEIATNPHISLYCLNDAQRQAVFVELPPGVDVSQAPFAYAVQHEQALRVFTVPYEMFHQLPGRIPDHLILVHNIGRCGSTLLHHIFNALDSVVSLSELDAFACIIPMRQDENARDDDLIAMLQSTTRMTFKSWPQVQTGVVKFRLQGIQLTHLKIAAFPQAQHLFMYRSAAGWVASIYRLASRTQVLPDFSREQALGILWEFFGLRRPEAEAQFPPEMETITLVELLATEWLYMMQRYLTLREQGAPLLGLRYEDLNQHPRPVIEALFRHCHLPESGIDTALEAMARDSQEGTSLARESDSSGNRQTLGAEQIEQINTILRQHPIIQTPDYVLPGTLEF